MGPKLVLDFLIVQELYFRLCSCSITFFVFSESLISPSMITFIVPVWNSIDYLPQAIDSILSQTVQDWRLLISDNCSTDGTREYLQKLMQKSDARISIFLQEKSRNIWKFKFSN